MESSQNCEKQQSLHDDELWIGKLSIFVFPFRSILPDDFDNGI